MGSHRFRPLMAAVALAGVLTLAVGVVLKHLGWDDYEFVVMTGCALLVVSLVFLYAVFPFHAKNDNLAKNMRLEPIWDFSMKATGLALSALVTGLVFRVEQWPGYMLLMLCGALCVLVAGGCWVYYVVQKKQFGNR